MELVARIVSKYMERLAEDLSVPHQWDEFLKARYEGGKKKVTNTNPKTKDRYPQVTMQTLFKSDDSFKKRVMKEYSDWISKSKVDETPPSKAALPYAVLGTHEDVVAFHKEHAVTIQKCVAAYTRKRQDMLDRDDDIIEMDSYFQFSEIEKESFTKDVQIMACCSDVVGDQYKAHFPAEYALTQSPFNSWRGSIYNPEALAMQEWVAGEIDPDDKGEAYEITPAKQKALQHQYLFTQAVFRELGITEITVFRGVQNQIEDSPEGSDAELVVYALSCWSMNINTARDHGRCCIAKVPVEQVFASPLTHTNFGYNSAYGETEFILMPAKGKDNIPVTVGVKVNE